MQLRDHREKRVREEAKIGCSRACPCVEVKLQKSLGGNLDSEKRASAHRVKIARRNVCGDGNLVLGNLGVAKAKHAEPGMKGCRESDQRENIT
jgi:hypothetical protein